MIITLFLALLISETVIQRPNMNTHHLMTIIWMRRLGFQLMASTVTSCKTTAEMTTIRIRLMTW